MLAACAVIAAETVFAGLAAGQTPSFTLLGTAPARARSQAQAVSADGRTVVGFSDGGDGQVAFSWRADTGRVDFGFNYGQAPTSTQAFGVSATGSIIVGTGRQFPANYRAIRAENGTIAALPLPTGFTSSFGSGVSGDGSVIGGAIKRNNEFIHGARWTSAGAQDLGFASPFDFSSDITGVSRDGSTLIGTSSGATNNVHEAATWTETGGWRVLGAVSGAGNGYDASPRGVNATGTVIVGQVLPELGARRAVVWRDGVASSLSSPGSTWTATAFGVSDVGEMIVGTAREEQTFTSYAMVWDGLGQFTFLQDYLTQRGVLIPAGIRVTACSAVSADGTVFAGIASGNGVSQAFVASVPAPAMSAMGAVLVAGCFVRRRRSA